MQLNFDDVKLIDFTIFKHFYRLAFKSLTRKKINIQPFFPQIAILFQAALAFKTSDILSVLKLLGEKICGLNFVVKKMEPNKYFAK